ncbi:MAG: hypothetical protein QOD95_2929 [Gammaproteobacteria bacterium]|jgi:hypothetical protein|nr:hypothetical protein [Gammaproteobacteria bacterium]
MGDVDEIGESERSDIPYRRLSKATYPHQRGIVASRGMEDLRHG